VLKNNSACVAATCVYILALHKILHAGLPQEGLSMGKILVGISQYISEKAAYFGRSVITLRIGNVYCVSSLAPIFEVRTAVMILLVIVGN
jgi:hypothetical protein